MSNTVEHLIHVICVPFRIRDKPHKRVYLQGTAKILEGSKVWKVLDDKHKLTGAPDNWSALQRYQARAYFHPFVQRFLYDPGQVQRFTRDDITSLQVDFGDETEKTTLELHVLRCELVLFQPDIGVLLLEVSPVGHLSLRDTQRLMDSLRRLYPPYLDQVWKEGKKTDQWKSGHCPAEVRLMDQSRLTVGRPGTYCGTFDPQKSRLPEFLEPYAKAFEKPASEQPMHFPWAAHWRTLLAPFNTADEGEGQLSAHQFGDDRCPTMSYLAVDNPRDISEGDWMRLCFADAPGNSRLPYAKRFMSEFEQTYCYDRFWYDETESRDAPSRILNCGYAFSYVGQANDSDFFANQTNGALPTFRHIHVTMGLIAHFQRAALLAASERLTEMVKREGAKICIPDREAVRDFYDQFVEFTQNFWFDEISPQIQGQQLFQKWRQHLRIQELYDEVHKELKDLVDYAELRAAAELNQTVSYFGAAAIVLAVVSAIAGIFGMNAAKDWQLENWTEVLPGWPSELLFPVPTSVTSVSVPLLLVSGITFLLVMAYVLYLLIVIFKRRLNRVRNFLKGQL